MSTKIQVTSKWCNYWEKKKVRLQLSVLGTQGTILEMVTPDIDGFTDEPVVHQCDVQVVENNFIDDFE